MQMEELKRFAMATDPLLTCSMCQCLLQEAVLLKCLHNCCRQCFSTAAVEDGCREGVRCNSCGAVTQVGSEQPNGFIDCQVQRYTMIAESRACGKCKENGEHDKPAMVWCPACRHSLCGDCLALHGQYNRQHATQSFEELKSLNDVCTQPSAAACGIHGKPLDIVCLNCELAKCTSCWASCKEKKHEVHIVSEVSFDRYIGNLISGISSIESELHRKSAVLERPKSILRDTKSARARHLENLKERKRRVVSAVEEAYEKIALCTNNAYDDIEAEGIAAAEAAERIDSDLSDAQSYIRRLVDSNEKCEMFRQQKILRERLSVLSAELDNLSYHLAQTTTREVNIETSLPENVEDVVRTWIGMPRTYSAAASTPPSPQQQQQQCLSFGTASVSVQLPVTCCDVALTKDGCSLLLAAQQHGLLEFSSSCGHELSRWRPPKRSSSSRDDEVLAVAALSDGRAAVSLYYTRLVVLLRRDENVGSSSCTAAAAADAWTEQLRFDPLPWSASLLSAHGDVLAACPYCAPGGELQLLSLSSGRRLSDVALQREYVIGSLAVAAGLIVTGSSSKLELGGGRRVAHVLDAHSLTAGGGSDERLWRHVLSSCDEEELLLRGVCADSSGGCLYAAACRSDRSSGRVCVLSLTDGSELRRFAFSISHSAAAVLSPWRLSLSDSGAVAAEQQRQSSDSSSGRVVLLAALHYGGSVLTVHRHGSSMHSLEQQQHN